MTRRREWKPAPIDDWVLDRIRTMEAALRYELGTPIAIVVYRKEPEGEVPRIRTLKTIKKPRR